MADPRGEFVSRIDLGRTRVRAFEGFIFLCGGEKGNDPSPVRSLRHLIYHELTSGRHSDIANRLQLAEDIQDWFDGGVYTDLVTLEEHLAGLSAVIVLVVESPGSIAELGAFAVSQAISDRLLVLVTELHYESTSFIRLGPIKKLENQFDRSVLVYDWHTRSTTGRVVNDFARVEKDLSSIVEEIKSFTRPHHGEHVFDCRSPAHIMFLICELCDLFGALAITEISGYLEALGIDLKDQDALRFTFLLEKCGLLAKKAKGHGRYYYPLNWRSRLSFGFDEGGHIDKERLRVNVVDFYKTNNKTRYDVVTGIRKAS